MKTNVLLREEQNTVDVTIDDGSKPEVTPDVLARWQTLIDIVADILDVPAGLIMRISNSHMNVFLKSSNEGNPYPADGKDTLLHGLYCETVIGRDQELHVANSLKEEAWKDNPDVALNMISYFGLPLKWDDGTVFGTICALDNKTNKFPREYRLLLQHFQQMIEQDLKVLETMVILERESGLDTLTGIANRRASNDLLDKLMEEYKRYNHEFAVVMIDLDKFKQANDAFGHLVGDYILQRFARAVSSRIRKVDVFARYGGDEFILLVKGDTEKAVINLMQLLKDHVKQDDFLKQYEVDFSYGICFVDNSINDVSDMIDIADKRLYQMKEKFQ